MIKNTNLKNPLSINVLVKKPGLKKIPKLCVKDSNEFLIRIQF